MPQRSGWHFCFLLATIALLALCHLACDGDRCAGVVNRCFDRGDQRCSGDLDAILTCQMNIDSCLVWTATESCGQHQECLPAEGGELVCACDDTCGPEGKERCRDNAVEICSRDQDGCLFWTPAEDCSLNGQTCTASDSTATCITTCQDECTAVGSTRCSLTTIQTCIRAENGCTYWMDGIDCDDTGQVCNDTVEPAFCEEGCHDECTSRGALVCSEDGLSVMTCTLLEDGCLDWVPTACGTGRHCCDVAPPPACYDDCTHACTPEGSTQCADTVIQTCTMQADGCRDWSDGTNCADTSQVCADVIGTADCYPPCTDECAPSAITQCADDTIQTCTLQEDGCRDWIDGTNCADTSQICSDVSGIAGCYPPCTDECTTTGGTRCSNSLIQTCTMQADGCRDWIGGTDCADTSQVCSDVSGTAGCYPPCTDDSRCDSANTSFCEGETIVSCVLQADGCLDAVAGTDCSLTADPFCLVSGDSASCVPCLDQCTSGQERCEEDVAQLCLRETGEDTCWEWQDDLDCFPWYCFEDVGTATCVNGTGESCTDILFVDTFPFVLAGTDFEADFSFDLGLGTVPGCEPSSGPDAVLGVELDQYGTIALSELGFLDAVIHVLDVCDDLDPTAQCLLSEDENEDWGVFMALQAGFYYVVLAVAPAGTAGVDYDLEIDLLPPESDCDDASDDEGDGLTDCDDPDCWDDPVCILRMGPWEPFSPQNPNDLEGCRVTFTPQTGWPFGYEFEPACPCEGPGWTVPGGGTSSTDLVLGDEAYQEYIFQHFPDFAFFGQTYGSVFVSANGHLTFGSGDDTTPTDPEEFFLAERIAGIAVDLDPSAEGRVVVDDSAGELLVSYVDIPETVSDAHFSFQIALYPDGSMEIRYLEVEDREDGVTGLSNGVDNDTPAPVHFNWIPHIPGTGDVIFTEFMVNPGAVDDDQGEYLELYATGPWDMELNCCSLQNSKEDGTVYHTYHFADADVPVVVPARDQIVLIHNINPAENGGVEGGYILPGSIGMRNTSAQTFWLNCQDRLVDTVPWETEAQWPGNPPEGTSVQLSPLVYDAVLNDNPDVWCRSIDRYPDPQGTSGDFGTPGTANTNRCGTVLFSQDFASNPGWMSSPEPNGNGWQWGVPSNDTCLYCPSGCFDNSCYGTNLNGEYDHGLGFSSYWLESGSIDLNAVTAPCALAFKLWLDMEAPADAATVLVRVGSDPWEVLEVRSPAYNLDDPTLDLPAGVLDSWTGSTGIEWIDVFADLSAYTPGTVTLRWALHTDGTNLAVHAGYYIDHLEVREFPP